MRNLVFLIAAFVATPVLAEGDCVQIARGMSAVDPAFPAIVEASAEPLVTWRASCAENPPTGDGNVTALCQASTQDDLGVFYWTKVTSEGGSSGFSRCAYNPSG